MVLPLPIRIPTYETVLGNWTRPDNIWCSNNPMNPIVSCNAQPSIFPPMDHLLIVTELDLSVLQATPFPFWNLQNVNFPSINKKLQAHLAEHCSAKWIRRKEDINTRVNSLVNVIGEEEIPVTKLSPFTKHWWMKELTNLKGEK